MRTLFITGGAGFIGSNLVDYCLAHTDFHMVVYDALTYASHREHVLAWDNHPRVTLVQGRTEDTLKLAEAIHSTRPDAILHLAAESHVDRSIADPLSFATTNVLGTTSLLTVVRQYLEAFPNPAFRLLNVSTDEVYGDHPRDALPSVETDPFVPSSPYSASKAAQDQLGFAFWRTYGVPVITVRLTNVYGPYQHEEKLIPCFVRRAMRGLTMGLYGDGQQTRDWLFVREAARGMLAALEHGQPGQAYNLGARQERTNLWWAETIADFVDREKGLTPGTTRGQITFVTDRPGHDRRYALNPEKAARELGFVAQPMTEAFIEETLRDYARTSH